jgi:DNA-binding transcriptional LysR family regulator
VKSQSHLVNAICSIIIIEIINIMANDSAPELRLLQLFAQLHATRSVTRTAEALGLSQPTVSIGLARLRTCWGDALFVRTGGGMLPTPRADALLATVNTVLAGLAQLAAPAPAFEPAQAQRHVRICMTDASHVTLLPGLLAHVRAVAPGITLEATRIDGQLAQALQSGEVDLALGYLPWLDAGCYQQALYDQDWVCLVNGLHPRVPTGVHLNPGPGLPHTVTTGTTGSTGSAWSRALYEAEHHVSVSSGTGQQLLDQALLAQGVQRRVVVSLPGFLGLPALLSTTDLVATLPRHIGETLARVSGLQVLPCPVAVPGFTVKQYWHERFHQDSTSRWLRSTCAGLFMRSPSKREQTALDNLTPFEMF